MVKAILEKGYGVLNSTKKLDFLAPLLMRLYLVPIFWMAGTHKIDGFENIVQWFGNDDWGLGLPFPFILAILPLGLLFDGIIPYELLPIPFGFILYAITILFLLDILLFYYKLLFL